MRGFREEAVLGKCTFCGYKVTEGAKGWQDRSARITYGRWICGSCLIGMKDGVDAALSNKEVMPSIVDIQNEVFKGSGVQVNPETGRLELVRPFVGSKVVTKKKKEEKKGKIVRKRKVKK